MPLMGLVCSSGSAHVVVEVKYRIKTPSQADPLNGFAQLAQGTDRARERAVWCRDSLEGSV